LLPAVALSDERRATNRTRLPATISDGVVAAQAPHDFFVRDRLV
jgi:hypothetical protein